MAVGARAAPGCIRKPSATAFRPYLSSAQPNQSSGLGRRTPGPRQGHAVAAVIAARQQPHKQGVIQHRDRLPPRPLA